MSAGRTVQGWTYASAYASFIWPPSVRAQVIQEGDQTARIEGGSRQTKVM